MAQSGKELPLWRSQIIVPVNVERYVAKAASLNADSIVLDLEDSITPPEKAAARGMIAAAAKRVGSGGADVLVRINRPLQLAVRDIEAVVSPEICGLVLPKVETASHLQLLAEVIDEVEAERGMPLGHTKVVALIETAEAFFHIREIAGAHERLVAISLGGEDFTLATRSQPDPEVLLFPKQQVIIAANAAGILPFGVIGSVANYQDIEGYRRAIAQSRKFGFRGGSCIHPNIVPLLNEGFGPTKEEVAEAERIIAGFEEAKAEGRGSVSVDGKMVDIPIVLRAQHVLDIDRRIKDRDHRVKQRST